MISHYFTGRVATRPLRPQVISALGFTMTSFPANVFDLGHDGAVPDLRADRALSHCGRRRQGHARPARLEERARQVGPRGAEHDRARQLRIDDRVRHWLAALAQRDGGQLRPGAEAREPRARQLEPRRDHRVVLGAGRVRRRRGRRVFALARERVELAPAYLRSLAVAAAGSDTSAAGVLLYPEVRPLPTLQYRYGPQRLRALHRYIARRRARRGVEQPCRARVPRYRWRSARICRCGVRAEAGRR